jgi:hypothetical protein
MANTPNLNIPLLAENQNGAELLVNNALVLLDSVVGSAGDIAEASSPPGTPSNGDRVFIVPTASGVFAGQEGKLGIYLDGTWLFFDSPFPNIWSSTEHQTGEYRFGSPVYSKTLIILAGPNAGTVSSPHGITGLNVNLPITWEFSATWPTIASYYGTSWYTTIGGLGYDTSITTANFQWTSAANLSAWTGTARLRYCKV